MNRQDLILGTIRTAVPAFIGWVLAWLIAQIPAVADVLAAIDKVLEQTAPGTTALVLLNGIAVAAVIAAYYWIVRKLGQRWPIVEAWLLGSAKKPTYDLVPTVQLSDGTQQYTTRRDYQRYLRHLDDDADEQFERGRE